ncbi:MAG TPA: TolC family protein [Vicinamibacterales bacterium]
MELLAMRVYQSIRRARTALFAVTALTCSASAFGQSGHSLVAAAQAAANQGSAQLDQTGATRRLSMDDAVKLALEQNLGIRIQRIDPQIQDLGVGQAKALWTPTLTSSISRNSISQPASSVIVPINQTGTFGTGLGMNQVLPWGGSYNATWNNQRTTTNSILSNFSPQLQSALNLGYTQPLIRNFSIDQIREQVQLSQKVRDLSDIQLQAVVTGTARAVRNAYWDLAGAIANMKAQQQSLELSQQSLRDNQKRVEIGTMAPIDIVQAQAEVASNEQGVIVAEATIKQAQDNLRTLILDPGAPDFWSIVFDPTDSPAFAAQAVDIDAAVRNALSQRSDLHSAKNSLEQSDVNIKFFRNQILPDVNATVNYGTFGIGGTQLSPVDITNPGAISAVRNIVTQRGYGSVLGDVFGSSYPQWSVGVQFGYPIGHSVSEANLARARLQYQQAQTQMKNLEMQVAAQVRGIGRNVQTNQQRVRSAGASRELQERKLEAEEKKLAAGMSSSFFVFQAQRDLSVARVAEIQAVLDYNKSLVDFEAVQQVPLNATINPSQLTTAGAGAIQPGVSSFIRQ